MSRKEHFSSIYAINAEVGNLLRIDESNIDIETLKELKERGIKTFSKFHLPISEIIVKLLMKTLTESTLNADDIDGVMVVTESYTELTDQIPENGEIAFRAGRNLIFEMLAEVGLDKAAVFSSTYGGSGNFLNAMFLADSVLNCNKIKNLLVICFDRQPLGISRIMKDAIAITGDGVSTFIYSNRKPKLIPFHEITHIGITPFVKVERYEDMRKKMLEMYRCTKSAASDCFETTNSQPANFSWLILNNYNSPTSKIFSHLLGFPLGKTWLHNTSRTGHMPSCDSIINFSDLAKSGNLIDKSKTLVFVNGPIFCGVLSITSTIPHYPATS